MDFKFIRQPKNIILFAFFALLLFMGHRTGFITVLTLFCFLITFIVPWYRYFDKLAILIISFTICFTLIGIASGFVSSVATAIAYFIPSIFFYFLGKYIVDIINHKSHLLWFIIVVVILYLFETYLTVIQTVISTGSILNTSRLFFFGGNEGRQLTATLVGLCASLGFIGLPISIIYKDSRIVQLLFMILFLLSLVTTVHLVNRTGLVICIFSLLFTLAYYYKSNISKIVFAVILCAILYAILVHFEVVTPEVLDAYAARNEADFTTGGNRTGKWAEAIHQLLISPLGWAENNGTTELYVHNMWLDIAKVTGILPFILLVLCTISSIKTLFVLLREKRDVVVAMLLSINICFFLSCFVEPVYGGLHFFLYVMIWGFQKQYSVKFQNS